MNLKTFLFIYSVLFMPIFNINGAAQITEKKEENIGLNYALLKAIEDQDEKEVENLIKYGANVNASLIRSSIRGIDSMTYPLHEAVITGNLNILRLLLESTANINQFDGLTTTPLMKAAYLAKKDIVKFLLTAGADINIVNLKKLTALEMAKIMVEQFKILRSCDMIKQYEEIVKLLEEAKLKQDLEEKRKKTTQILIESGHLIEPLAKLTAEYAVGTEDIKL